MGRKRVLLDQMRKGKEWEARERKRGNLGSLVPPYQHPMTIRTTWMRMNDQRHRCRYVVLPSSSSKKNIILSLSLSLSSSSCTIVFFFLSLFSLFLSRHR